jgi:hypothetical protein
MGTGAVSPEKKQPGREAEITCMYSPCTDLTSPNIAQYRAEFKNVNTAFSKQKQDLTYLRYQEIFAVDTASLHKATQPIITRALRVVFRKSNIQSRNVRLQFALECGTIVPPRD